jgi:hypothetical protein
MISNVEAFDEIFTDMTIRTKTATDQTDLISIAQMVSFSQREQYHIVNAASKGPHGIFPFLNYDIVSVETNLKNDKNDAQTRPRAIFSVFCGTTRVAELHRQNVTSPQWCSKTLASLRLISLIRTCDLQYCIEPVSRMLSLEERISLIPCFGTCALMVRI